jgi:uncharacterized protein (TIGR03083 family)
MSRIDSRGLAALTLEPVPVLAAYHDGVTAICELAAQFSPDAWSAATPCAEWRAADLAGHLRCAADDYNEYLDDAPASRFARLMATGARPETLERKLARQHAAELAALPDVSAPEHIAAFAESALGYARRLTGVWNLPHHRYRDAVVTVAGMAEAACAEWHLHAWDLARALGQDYRPAAPHLVLAGWRAGMPHVQPARGRPGPDGSCRGAAAGGPGYGTPGYGTPGYGTPGYGTPGYGTPGYGTPGYGTPGYGTPAHGTLGYGTPGYGTPAHGTLGYGTPAYGTPRRAGAARGAGQRGGWRSSVLRGARWRGALRAERWRPASRGDPWRALLVASGRSPEWRV